jgi:hypothetical protein
MPVYPGAYSAFIGGPKHFPYGLATNFGRSSRLAAQQTR